ncbi:AKR1, partial [Symbiodinium microadriaticum]
MAESAKIKEHEEFLRRAKYFKMRLLSIESLKQAESEVLLQPNCLWQDVVTTIAEVFSLDSSAWIDHMILIDGDGDELSKHIDNATLFWKTAATYNFEDNKVFTITLSLKEINKTREVQEHAAFMAAAEHIPLVLASNTKSTATLDMMLHSSWDAVCEKVLEIFHLDPPKSITKLHLVDEEFDELSPPVQNSEKFWKIYLQNYQAGAGMAFAVHMSNESFWKDTPKCENSPLATRIVPTDAGPPTASLTTNSQPTEAVPIKQEDPEDILESASTESVCSQFAEVSPEVISEYHEACEKGDLPAVRNFIEVVKIDPNLRNTNLSTGMHFACLKGHLHVAQFLSESGGKTNSANSVGLTPLD